jgi:hypothetical protein
MARTFVQQSQISGSLSYNDSLESGVGLTSKQTLGGDLDALRSQVKRIIGGSNWYDALSGSQDLADIYAAVRMTGANADFQGALDVTGVATFDSAITGSAGMKLAGDLDVNSSADFQGAVNLQSTLNVTGKADFAGIVDVADTLSASVIKIDGDVAGRLYIVDADGSIKDEANLTFSGGSLSVTGGVTGSAGLKVAGDADFNSSADFQGAVNLQSSLTVAGLADLNGALDVAGVADFGAAVYMDSSLGVSGSLAVAGVASFAAAITGSAGLSIAGDMEVDGPAVMNDGLTVTGDRLEVTGSFGLTGAADFDSTLNVDGVADFKAAVYAAGALGVSGSLTVAGAATLSNGLTVNGAAADFNAGVTANSIKIDGDVAQRLYIVDADGFISDEAKLTFDGSELWVNGDLEVVGGDITMSNSMSISSATAGKMVLTSDLVEASGDLKVAGNDISGSAGLNITLESGGDVKIAGDLQLMGNELKSSAGNVVLELSGDDAYFKSDVHVAGDLYVKGAMTYIETTNLKVKDAFIHLATGSTGAENSGIVLHGGAGASADLMLAQDGGAGEFVFAKLAHSSQDHADVDGDNSVTVNGAELVATWMSGVKFGALEGSASGSLGITTNGIRLLSESGKDITIGAGSDLLLSANNETPISFVESGESAAFDSKFDATSIVGALNELFDMIGGGSAAKGDLSSANVAAGVLTFSSVGTLTAAEHKLIDVYLNGVLLSPSRDLSSLTTTTVTLDSGIASGLMVDDVITVVIRSAA